GLPDDQFTVADTPASGELVRDPDSGELVGKRFRISASIKSADVREIPRLAFSYYNPQSGVYETTYSQPIALSVEGSAVVSADDVVSGVKRPDGVGGAGDAGRGDRGGDVGGSNAFVGADLSLSSRDDTLAPAWSVAGLRPLLIALHILPLLLLGFQLWRLRTRERRGKSSETRGAMRAVSAAIERASSAPARDAAPELLAAIKQLAATAGRSGLSDQAIIARIETVAYDPRAADEPLDRDLLDQARELAESLAAEGRARARGATGSAAATVLVGALVGAASLLASPVPAVADRDSADDLDSARAAYQAALAESDRDARTRAFARAELLMRELAAARPDRPELLADWGNAALGAQDLGRATLAYRRALALAPGHDRAQRNLSWVRERMPGWLPKPTAERAGDSLFFWTAMSVPMRYLFGSLAFAVAILLLVP
ncbi:MAG: hypothetical protein AAGC55_29910, partial [Myxococcota bacterium]